MILKQESLNSTGQTGLYLMKLIQKALVVRTKFYQKVNKSCKAVLYALFINTSLLFQI